MDRGGVGIEPARRFVVTHGLDELAFLLVCGGKRIKLERFEVIEFRARFGTGGDVDGRYVLADLRRLERRVPRQ